MPIPTTNRSPSRLSLALLFGAATIAGAIWASRCGAANTKQSHHDTTDKHRDDTLQDTYPASDAPATRDYAIPVNAR